MTDERVVPKDFPRETVAASLAGSHPKLPLRKIGDRYFAHSTGEELYERYDVCEDLAQQLAVYTQRKIDTDRWDLEEALRRVELSVDEKVRAGVWDFSPAEIAWLMTRTGQIMTGSDARASNAVAQPPTGRTSAPLDTPGNNDTWNGSK